MMSSFTISPTLNKDRVFLLQKSELEKRFDPYFYLPKFKELEERLKKYSTKKLSQVAIKIFSGSTPLSKGEAYTDRANGIPFVRSGDFNIDGSINFDDLIYLQRNVHETNLASSKLQKNDVLFAIVGATIGKVGIYKSSKEANINQAVCVVRFNNDINPEFVNVFFQTAIGQSLIDRIKRPVARANINLDEVGSLPIILPSTEIQNKAVDIFKKSLEQKKQNETAAEKLLASIDYYLLKELGITLPIPPENILKNRMFISSIKSISGNRFDPLYHQGSIYGGLEKSKFKYKNFKEISKYFINGFAAGKQDQNIFGEGIIQIRPTNISDKREFVFNKNIYIDLSRKNDLKNELLCKNEVLFNNTNSQELVGKACVFNLEGDYFCSNHITRIGLYEEYISDYVGVILNLYQKNKVFYKSCINWNNQSGINLDILKTIKIPVPPFDKQKEIAEHITDIRTQAQQLKVKTKEELKKTSNEIEKILLTQ